MIFAVVSQGGWAAGLLLASLGAGSLLTRRLKVPRLDRAVYGAASGLGLLSFGLLLLAFSRLLRPLPVFALLAAFALLGLREAAALLASGRPASRVPLLAVAGIPVALAPSFWWSLYPPHAWDETAYHLPAVRDFVRAGGLVVLEGNVHPVFNFAGDLLFAPALLAGNDVATHAVSIVASALLALLLFVEGRRLSSRSAGLLSAALWLGSPIVAWLSSNSYIDVQLALFGTAALGAADRASGQDDSRLALLAGALAGMAIAVKYSGVSFAILAAVVVALAAFQRRRPFLLLVFAVATAIPAVPWLARNFALTGNPVPPFLPAFFGGGTWSPGSVLHWQATQTSFLHGPTDFASLPVLVAFRPRLLLGETWAHPAIGLAIALLPLALALRGPSRRPAAAAALLVLFWLATSQQLRYLLPVFPLLALTLALAAGRLRQSWPLDPRTSRAAKGVLGILLLGFGWTYAARKASRYLPVPLSAAARDEWLEHRFPTYPAYRALNLRYGSEYRIVTLGDDRMTYFAEGTFLGTEWGTADQHELMAALDAGGDRLARLVERYGARFFLVNLGSFRGVDPVGPKGLPRFEVLRENRSYRLFCRPSS